MTASPTRLWQITRSSAGITKRYFQEYFKGRSEAHAFEILCANRYNSAIDPREVKQSFRAPQSFVYLDTLKGFDGYLANAA